MPDFRIPSLDESDGLTQGSECPVRVSKFHNESGKVIRSTKRLGLAFAWLIVPGEFRVFAEVVASEANTQTTCSRPPPETGKPRQLPCPAEPEPKFGTPAKVDRPR